MTNRYSNAKQKTMSKGLVYVLGPLGFFITSGMPAAVQLYFAAAGFTGLVQSTLMFNPTFRRMTGMSQLPPPQDAVQTTPGESKNLLQELKESYGNMKETASNQMNERTQKNESRKQLSDEARLQAEYYESLRERMAELEKKMKRRP